MTYYINKTNGDLLLSISEGTKNTSSTSITLIGKNAVDFGEAQNENFVKLLEHFANETAPLHPLKGQLWFDITTSKIKLYDGTIWRPISGTTVDSAAPTTPLVGDAWWDTDEDQLKVYSGNSTWDVVGPAYGKTQGKAGAIVETIYTSTGQARPCVMLYSAGNRVAIINDNDEFTPNVALTGFSSVSTGITLSSNANVKVHGTVTNSDSLGNIAAANYVRSDVTSTVESGITVNGTVTVGAAESFTIAGDISSTVQITNQTTNANTHIRSNVSGVITTALTVNGSTGLITVAADPTNNLGVATKQYVDVANATQTTAMNSGFSGVNVRLASIDSLLASTIDTVNSHTTNKADLNSPALTGTPTAPTATTGDASTKLATTQFVATSVLDGLSTITIPVNTVAGRQGDVTLSVLDVEGAAPSLNPDLTGAPTATTPSVAENSTRIATTAYVKQAIAAATNSLWQGSSKRVETRAPNSSEGEDGDIWFQI